MDLGIVEGTVISDQNSFNIPGGRYLLINKCNQSGQVKNDFVVALDLVNAGKDEMVMIAQSTSARETPVTRNKAIDAIVVGIIDKIDKEDKMVYKK